MKFGEFLAEGFCFAVGGGMGDKDGIRKLGN